MPYTVYQIKIQNVVRYVGRTNNLHRRQLEHNRLIKNSKGSSIHQYCRDNGLQAIELIPIKVFKTKIESKRYEMYLILVDYFNRKDLIQKIPNISDR